ncbi:hypothetical protein SEA_ROBINROSE_22 [Microbacterium phage RobinRose]|nr:hypothetical protein SEA_ROBINROSE_22 [Microbacterium phage RobinRose]
MQISARFYVHSLTRTNTDYLGVVLNPVLRSTEDNVQWAKFTPSGKIEMNVHRDTGAAAEFERALEERRDIAITFEVLDS